MSESDEVRSAVGDNAEKVAGYVALLYTPAQAATLLQVRESWLRRRAGEGRVRCSFMGKHLRFSREDLEAIVAEAARPIQNSPDSRNRIGSRRLSH